MVIVVLEQTGYPLRYALGDFFAQRGVSDEEVRMLIEKHYEGQATAGDPAAGVAQFVEAVTERLVH
jgi:hypothetical protein